MKSRVTLALAAVALVLLPAGPGQSAPERLTPEMRFDRAVEAAAADAAAAGAGAGQVAVVDGFEVVGHTGLGGGSVDFADVWAHGSYAYVGSRCGDPIVGGRGVSVVDISTASSPHVVARLPNPDFSRAEDVVVRHVDTADFQGELAVVGVQVCFDSGHEEETRTGLWFFDVTDAKHPALLSRWQLPLGDIGCHEVDLAQRSDGVVLAGCAHNFVDQAFVGTPAVEFVDVTDPHRPVSASTWTMQGVDPFGGLGCAPVIFAHSVRFQDGGRSAYVSYWDAGVVRLGLGDPSAPRRTATTQIAPPDEDGDAHSTTLVRGGRWLVVNPEDTSPLDCPGASEFGGFGEAYVYRQSADEHTQFLGTFSTPHSRSSSQGGVYTVHNTEAGNHGQFFSSWYSDGIVWWTMDKDGVSTMRGQFVPKASDTIGIPLVWGVYVQHSRDLVLASDLGSGLWILRPVGADDI
ncbi:MAG: hypothetical protein ABJC60_10655 [Actinomycetota bacterium]